MPIFSDIYITDFGCTNKGGGDASAAILKALDKAQPNQKVCIPYGDYDCAATWDLRPYTYKKSVRIECDGNLYFNKKAMDGIIIGGNKTPSIRTMFHSTGSIQGAFMLQEDESKRNTFTNSAVIIENAIHADVSLFYVSGFKDAVVLQAIGKNQVGCFQNRVKFDRIINCVNGIVLKSDGHKYNYVNSNKFIGGTVAANNGVVFSPMTGTASRMNCNYFYDFDLEGIIEVGVDFNNAEDCKFFSGRTYASPENREGVILFKMPKNSWNNEVYTTVYDYTVSDQGVNNKFLGTVLDADEKVIYNVNNGISLKK